MFEELDEIPHNPDLDKLLSVTLFELPSTFDFVKSMITKNDSYKKIINTYVGNLKNVVSKTLDSDITAYFMDLHDSSRFFNDNRFHVLFFKGKDYLSVYPVLEFELYNINGDLTDHILNVSTPKIIKPLKVVSDDFSKKIGIPYRGSQKQESITKIYYFCM